MHHDYFWSTFTITFLAELPDKTTFAVLILATRSKPFLVFTGAAVAFAVQCMIAVLFGGVLGLLPHEAVRIGSGVLFLVSAVLMGLKLWWQNEEPCLEPKFGGSGWQTVWMSFGVVFLAEWGDLTQFSTALLAARFRTPFLVFLAATLALCSVSGIAILVGNRVRTFLRPAIVKGVAVCALAVVGVCILLGIPRM